MLSRFINKDSSAVGHEWVVCCCDKMDDVAVAVAVSRKCSRHSDGTSNGFRVSI